MFWWIFFVDVRIIMIDNLLSGKYKWTLKKKKKKWGLKQNISYEVISFSKGDMNRA